MTSAAASAVAVNRALDRVMRDDRGRLLSALIARLGDMQRAEDALHEALASALTHWGRNGVPASPQGWLLQVAWRKALDRLRRGSTEARGQADLLIRTDEAAPEGDDIPDHRLRLIFTCCHPALEEKSRVALTLRAVCGLTTPEIARAFLDADTTMGQRLSRAKAKIAGAGIAYRVPDAEEWPTRLHSVLAVIYLIFNAGYTAGPSTGRDLCLEAIFLARLMDQLCPGGPETEGILALLLITDARRPARVDDQGATVALTAQDRALWNHDQITEGLALLDRAMQRRAPGPYQIKAAIAACHVQGDAPDWLQIAALYESLLRHEPTPVVRLNHAVALAEAGNVPRALAIVDGLAPVLQGYQPFHAAAASVYARVGRVAESADAYDRAIALATSFADATFLRNKRAALRHD